MSSQPDLENLIWQEIMSHYLADELPPDDEFEALLPVMARDSAGRLYSRLGGQRIADMVALLRAAGSEADHPLLHRLTDTSNVGWIDEAGQNTLATQLRRIADSLEALPSALRGRQT